MTRENIYHYLECLSVYLQHYQLYAELWLAPLKVARATLRRYFFSSASASAATIQNW